MSSDANLKTWVSDRLMSLLGHSQPTVVQYIIGLAKKASSPADIVGNLAEFGFSSSGETRAFADEMFARVPRTTSGVNLYQKQEREAAMLAKKQKTYQLLDADDDDDDIPKPSTTTSAEPRKGDSHKKRFRKKTENQDDEQDDEVVVSREKSRQVRQEASNEDDDDSEFGEERLRDQRESEELERHMKERDASRTRKLTEAKLSKKEEEVAIRRSSVVEQEYVASLSKMDRDDDWDDLDLSVDMLDFLEEDALRQISQRKRNSKKNVRDADHPTQAERSKRTRTSTCLTRENFHRGDKKELDFIDPNFRCKGLHDMFKVWPSYMLFESACGYALFLAHGVYEIEKSYEAVEKYVKRFDEVFKLIAFHRFESVVEALNEFKAISEGIVSNRLMNFLELNLPKPREGFSLALNDTRMINPIAYTLRIACTSSRLHFDVTRGLRMHIDKFIKDMKPGDFEKARLDMARLYCRQRLIQKQRKGSSVQKEATYTSSDELRISCPLL